MPQAATNSKASRAGNSRKANNTKAKQMGAHRQVQPRKESSTLLEKFLLDALKDIYWAEKHLTKALPKLKKAATSEELKSAFEDHLAVTEEHVSRLEQVFEMIGKKAQAKKCEAMEGLSKEADSIIEETEENTATRDVGLIVAAQKVEHYEIATYGGLVQIAKILGYTEASDLLSQTLGEEKDADKTLTSIAENDINLQAEEEGEGEEERED